MQAFVRTAAVAIVVLLGSQSVPANEAVSSSRVPGVAASTDLPIVIGQTTTNSSSSGGSYRIPRGVIRLAVAAGIGLIGAAGWAIKKMTAA